MATNPGARDLLLAFLTYEFPDALRHPASLAEWLEGHGLAAPGTEADAAQLTRARHLRGALRSLFLANCGYELDSRSGAAIEEVTRHAPLTVKLDEAGLPALTPAGAGVDAALSRLVAQLHTASLTGKLPRYKACRQCGMAFFDATKNRSRIWCEMATCGSQQKSRAYRARRSARAAE